MKKIILISLTILALGQSLFAQVEDPYLWLEEVDGKEALEFVNKQNKATMDKFSQQKDYQNILAKSLEIFDSKDRIAYPKIQGNFIYNFWQDKDHERGIWRRTAKSSYINGKPAWETLLDLDELSKKDSTQWVFKGATGLYPKYDRFMVKLSNGGADAVVIREFDVVKKSFIENGFYIDEAKSEGSYLDENTLIVSTDFGAGTMTTSGYPRQVKLWKRATLLKDAQLIFECDTAEVGAFGYLMRDGELNYLMVTKYISFFTMHTFVQTGDKMVKLDIPEDSQINDLLNNQLILSLKSDWNADGIAYKQGDLISLNFTSLLKGKKEIGLILRCDEFTSVSEISKTKNTLLVNVLTNVKNELYLYSYDNKKWKNKKVNAPDLGSIFIRATDEFTEQYFFTFTNFLTPATLYLANAQDNSSKLYKSLPSFFDASKHQVAQYKVKSNDGTMVPFFVVSSKAMEYNSKNPVLLYAYGGFEASQLPYYDGAMGRAWLENGGVYVLANIRGGGEYGPKWHQSGAKEKRQNSFNDFHAVAEDLIAKKITSNNNLGILGESNSGLLVGVAFTQRPELYNAVFCASPLLDMKRYPSLGGTQWLGEYGDPDKPEEWEYLSKYSPYQNLKKDIKYPEVFFFTSTRDDRVQPGHARKMAAKMIDMGYPIFYYENTDGGHSAGSTNEQRAKFEALVYSYMLMKLKN